MHVEVFLSNIWLIYQFTMQKLVRILKYDMLLNYYRVLLCGFTSEFYFQVLHQSISTVLLPYVLLNIRVNK